MRFVMRKNKTNADRIRSMTNEELAEWLHNIVNYVSEEDEMVMSIYNLDSKKEEEISDNYGSLLTWLNTKANTK